MDDSAYFGDFLAVMSLKVVVKWVIQVKMEAKDHLGSLLLSLQTWYVVDNSLSLKDLLRPSKMSNVSNVSNVSHVSKDIY